MKYKKPLKDKIFWSNFSTAMLGFIIVWLVLGWTINHPDEGGLMSGGFLDSYIILSAFCVIGLAIKIGEKYRKYEEINEKTESFLKKEKISIQEFRKKYRDVIAIYDNSNDFFDDDLK
ncbi:MAG: hypothetical protein WC842_03415 [Candidatus Paceibacterota bacterium]|jgi:hypothetical protein